MKLITRPFMIGLVLAIGLFFSGSAFWTQLPNNDLGAIWDANQVQFALDTGHTNIWLVAIRGLAFTALCTIWTVLLLTFLFNDTHILIGGIFGGIVIGGIVVGVIIGLSIGFGLGIIISKGIIDGSGIGSLFICLIVGFFGGYVGGLIGGVVKKYLQDREAFISSLFAIFFTAILIFADIRPFTTTAVLPQEATAWWLERTVESQIKELTEVSLQRTADANATSRSATIQANQTNIAAAQTLAQKTIEANSTVRSATIYANQTATAAFYEARLSALIQTQTAIAEAMLSMRQSSTPAPVTLIPTLAATPEAASPAQTPDPTITVNSPTLDINSNPAFGTGGEIQVASDSKSVEEYIDQIKEFLSHPALQGFGVIVGIIISLFGLLLAWRQVQKLS